MLGDITLWVAFSAGVVSFFSPCLLPLIPVYFMYIIGGDTIAQNPDNIETQKKSLKRRGFFRMLGFVLGFTLVFILLGLGATAIGQILIKFQAVLTYISAAFIIFFGAMLAGIIKIPMLMKVTRKAGSTASSFGLGMAFAFGWTPCFGPVLGAILATTAVSSTGNFSGELSGSLAISGTTEALSGAFLNGAILLLTYSLGLALPFILSYFFLSKFESKLSFFEKYSVILSKITGILMISLGLLIATGMMKHIVDWLLKIL